MQQEIIAEACSGTFRYCWPSHQACAITGSLLTESGGVYLTYQTLPMNLAMLSIFMMSMTLCLKMQNVAQNLIHPLPNCQLWLDRADDKEMSKDLPIVPPQLPNGFLGSHHSDEEDFCLCGPQLFMKRNPLLPCFAS